MAPAAGLVEARAGAVYAALAYGLWGTYALFFKLLENVPPLEVVAHRAIWSVPVAAAALLALGRLRASAQVLLNPRLLGALLFTALLIAVNWGLFVWAVFVGRTLETSLAYYISPLFAVAIGVVFLRERLSPAQGLAIALTVLAVLIQSIAVGVLPWLALTLAATFAVYGYLRKTIAVLPVEGFLVEAAILSVLTLIAVGVQGADAAGRFLADPTTALLLLASGPMTALPLMLFAAAARRLKLSTVGIMQYIAPSGLFLTAVLAFGEPLNVWTAASFLLIWTALAIYTISALRSEAVARVP